MRFKNLLLWDMKFQGRYGFYLLYGILTAFYIVLLHSLPQSWKENAAAILIYSDPAAMGLFFMGAIILLEKSQRVTSFFAILHLFDITPDFLRFYPGNVCMDLIAGRSFSGTGLILTMVLIVILFWGASRCVMKTWQNAGGVKL